MTKLRAGAAAALFSGLPSTIHALATGRDPLEATVAAGSIALPREDDRARLLIAAVPVHLALSALWTLVLAKALPLRRPVLEGTLAGVAISILDLGLIGRRFPRIRNLQSGPQIADHIAFGVIAATALAGSGDER